MSRGKHKNFQFFLIFMHRKQTRYPQDIHKSKIQLYILLQFLYFFALSLPYSCLYRIDSNSLCDCTIFNGSFNSKNCYLFFFCTRNKIGLHHLRGSLVGKGVLRSPLNVLTPPPAVRESIRARFSKATEPDSEPDF